MAKSIKIRTRIDYSKGTLNESDIPSDPFELLKMWFGEAVASSDQQSVMILSTANQNGIPSSRVVLIKAIDRKGLTFYSNYSSRKGVELEQNPFASAICYWPELERQLRVEGKVSRLPSMESDKYFDSRPEESRINAIISPQSQPIANRDYLLEKQEEFKANLKLGKSELKRPEFWGGYVLEPYSIEFWQGRPGRLNDRLLYSRKGGSWQISRLAP